MENSVRAYLAAIGRNGGTKSRRHLSGEEARQMVKVREARRAFRRYYTSCFWSYNPNLVISNEDVAWVGKQLMKHGGRQAWIMGAKLCR